MLNFKKGFFVIAGTRDPKQRTNQCSHFHDLVISCPFALVTADMAEGLVFCLQFFLPMQ